MSVNQMSSKPTITKDELVSLLKAAHQAYPKQPKPPENAGEDWIEWYASFIIEQIQKPSQPTQVAQPPASPAPSAPPPRPAAVQPPVTPPVQPAPPVQPLPPIPRPSTARLPENPTRSQPAEPPVSPTGKTDKLEDAGQRKTEPDTGVLQVCPTCAHRNRPGVFFCENCGTNLMTGQQAVMGTRDLREAQDIEPNNVREALSTPDQPPQPTASPAIQLDKEQEKAVRSAGTSQFETGMLLRIEVEGGSAPIIIKPKNEDMILGRRDPTTGATPEVDLTTFAGYRMGVSRRHASLALENNQIGLWDLGSSNGTYLNGNKLTPHQPSPVRDGDEVRLGQMVLRLFFQNTPGVKT